MTRAERVLRGGIRFGVYAVPATVAWTTAGVHIAIGIAAAAALVLWAATRRWPLARTSADLAMAAFALASVAATICSEQPAASAYNLRKLLLLPLAHLVVLACDTPHRARMALRLFVAGIAITAAVAIVRFVAAELATGTRLRSTGHYMTFAGLLVLATPLAAAGAAARRGRSRAGYAAATAVLAVALVLSFTRGAWLGTIAAAMVMLWRRQRRALWAVPAAVALALWLAPQAYRDRARSAFDPHHPFNAERTDLWRTGLEVWREHPWTGVGMVDLGPFYAQRRRDPAGRLHGHVHDNWLQIAATLGTPGLLAFLWLMVAYGRIAARAAAAVRDAELRRLADGIWGAFWGFQVMGLFEWNFGDVEVTIALVFLIGCALALGAKTGDDEGAEVSR